MGRAARTGPGCAAMIVTLSTDIDVGIVLVCEDARGSDKIIMRRGDRIAQLKGINRPLMWVVASDANHADIGIADRQMLTLKQAQPRRAGVAAATTIDPVRRVHVLHNDRVRAGLEFFEGW